MIVLSLPGSRSRGPRRSGFQFVLPVIALCVIAAPATVSSKTLPAAAATTRASADPIDLIFQRVSEIVRDDFDHGLDLWSSELQSGGSVEARDGALVIDVPAGCTVWLKAPLEGPVMIEYEATVVSRGGPNDRVSDLNCFWMARDARSPDDLFATRRHGKFEEYNFLRGYYAGVGGNSNTTTRFRRYIGDAELRPLLPQHDLHDEPRDLLTANTPQVMRIIACGKRIEFWRDERRLFEMNDEQPYTSGHFAFRTTHSHLEIRRFRVYRIKPIGGACAGEATTTTTTTKAGAQ